MAGSTIGNKFTITTWGESHGKALGVVVDGCPAGLPLCEEDIQVFLDRRKPGFSQFSTPRKESDTIEILSGIFEGKTTGTPISMMVRNTSQRSGDYGDIATYYRPGHADYTFDEKYGHLRSGTYDKTCETYAQREFDLSKGSAAARKQRQTIEELKHNPLDSVKLMEALEDIGFYVDLREFLDFLKDSMEEREFFKFEFTKTLSLAIDILIDIGDKLGISKEDMAYLEVPDIQLMVNRPAEFTGDIWRKIIDQNKKKFQRASMLILPDVIYDPLQLKCIEIWEARPNFITSECVTGDILLLENYENEDHEDVADVQDKIVVLPKADPGYDWIFAKGIKGFITKYGGVASHMAIRCAEFNIPAAIGCGDCIYSFVEKQQTVTLDCAHGKITKGV